MAPLLPFDEQYLIQAVLRADAPIPDQPTLLIPPLLCDPDPEFFGDEASLLVPLAHIPMETSMPEVCFFPEMA